jgi:hypothetical protein
MMHLATIGRAERIDIIGHEATSIPAKVDTGADISSIWATEIVETQSGLEFVLFAKGSEFYSGERIVLPAGDYRLTRVANSFGHKEMRYVVKLSTCILDRRIVVSFTLADRSNKIYPILLGRKMLHKKFLVDVSKGEPLAAAEKAKLRKLHVALSELQD